MRDGTAPLDKVASYGTQPMKASTLTACEKGTQLRRWVHMGEGNWLARLSCDNHVKPFSIELAIQFLEKRKIIEINKNNTPYSNKNGKQNEAQEMNGDVSSVLEICDERLTALQPCCTTENCEVDAVGPPSAPDISYDISYDILSITSRIIYAYIHMILIHRYLVLVSSGAFRIVIFILYM